MKRLLVLLLGALLVGVVLVGRAPQPRVATAADASAAADGVVVEGLGKVTGTPDVLRASLGVSVRRADLTRALADANARQSRLTAALRRAGVAADDVQTSDVNVGPSYDNRGRPDGYQVTETLTAKLRDLSRAGRVLSQVLAAAGEEAVLQGVSFALEDDARLLGQARDAAFADARAKAERYAKLAGRSLGAVQLVTESTSSEPRPVPYAALAPRAAGDAVPVSPGTSDVTVGVTVRWALR